MSKLIEYVLTAGTLLFNVGYQVPQVILLKQQVNSDKQGPLNASTIMIKTTGLYLACSFFLHHGVPLLSWLYQITSILLDWMMIYYCARQLNKSALVTLAQIVLHIAIVATAIVFTPIALYGALCKTILTMVFKFKTMVMMVYMKSSSNVAPLSYALSMTGNVFIALLNQRQKNLVQIYFNVIVMISMDVVIISLSRLYRNKEPKKKVEPKEKESNRTEETELKSSVEPNSVRRSLLQVTAVVVIPVESIH